MFKTTLQAAVLIQGPVDPLKGPLSGEASIISEVRPGRALWLGRTIPRWTDRDEELLGLRVHL